jgi:hypothetical protein
MTGAVDRINAWIVGRRRRPLEPRFADDALEIGGQSYRLCDLTQAVACQEELFAGQRLALVLGFGSGRVVRLSQEDRCWSDVLAALDRLNLAALPSAEWTTRLIAGAQTLVLRG